MTSLLTDPLWKAEDLGKPIPKSPHAVSVAMPLWAHAVGYEEGDPAVTDKLASGYPRFVYHPKIGELARICAERFAHARELCLPLPSKKAAEEARDYVAKGTDEPVRVEAFGRHDLHAIVAPLDQAARAKAYWQHTGRIVSSRLAEAVLQNGARDDTAGDAAKEHLREQLAEIYSVEPEHIYLFGTGMDAVTTALELGAALAPGRGSVQFGFPYVDVLKVQEEFGSATQFYADENDAALAELAAFLRTEKISSIVIETPANPLLLTPDVATLGRFARDAGALLIVDDTVATGLNVDVGPWADLVATSLTKNFAGHGDVMGGALVISPASPHAAALAERIAATFEDLLWWEDAVVLDRRSRSFAERMRSINTHTLDVARFLADHPAVEEVYYPGLEPDPNYEAIRRADGGYGGLFSFLPRNAAETSQPVYDRLRISKGPSLGTDYTLCCPYTILAHYAELDWAEACGVSRWLIRVSVGLEDPQDIKARFDEALKIVPR